MNWRTEAKAVRERRATLTDPLARIEADNARAESISLPVGLLVAALEIEEREEANYIPPVLRSTP